MNAARNRILLEFSSSRCKDKYKKWFGDWINVKGREVTIGEEKWRRK